MGEYGGAVGEGGFTGLLLLLLLFGSGVDEIRELSEVLIVRAGILDCCCAGCGVDTAQVELSL